ncbi:zinc-binding dehydrogenase [uncultured Aquimarina sp.]|uniref:quinone oxidoreductase family protein n=1 Tax=uncultured Aquimarina sp. TaxID=575652 RepID=UPI0026038082|nr:zinc-binding dehydrogenase [uncultured Aquimarina sp.]
MKAALIRSFGGYDVFEYTDIETPSPNSGEVIIKILATGVNRIDHYLREGVMMPNIPLPHILGSDAVGEIIEIGSQVSNFNIGDRVIPMPGFPMNIQDHNINPITLAPSYGLLGAGCWGTYAEYVKVPEVFIVKDNTELSPEEIATLPMVTVTGVRAIKEVGKVKEGDNVVILGGSSGTGSFHVQLAKALGAKVLATTTSESKTEYIKSLGADMVINTSENDLVEMVKEWTNGKGANVVIDNLGGSFLQQSINALKPSGIVVAMGFVDDPIVSFDVRSLFFPQKVIKGSIMGTKEDLEFGLELVRKGKITAQLDKILPLREAKLAHEMLVNKQVKGNIVLSPLE